VAVGGVGPPNLQQNCSQLEHKQLSVLSGCIR